MLDASLYDQHDLQNKTIIWLKYGYYKSFHIEEQCVGGDAMVISECSLYAMHEADEFYKVDTDYLGLFIVKELYTNG